MIFTFSYIKTEALVTNISFDPNTTGGFAHGIDPFLTSHNGIDIFGLVCPKCSDSEFKCMFLIISSQIAQQFQCNHKYTSLAVGVFRTAIISFHRDLKSKVSIITISIFPLIYQIRRGEQENLDSTNGISMELCMISRLRE